MILNTNDQQLYGLKYSCLIQINFKQIYLTDGTLTGTTTLGQSEPGVMAMKE